MKLTKDINKYIFRGYDIRGVYPQDLNEDVSYTIGKSFGTYIQKLGKKKCVVGRDNRLSSEELEKALIKGILETGVDVIMVGLVTTPMYYYACIRLGVPSGIMVTASHNPKDDNGYKFAFDERGNARGEMIEEFRNFTYEMNFAEGAGKLFKYDVRNDYKALFQKSLNFGPKRLKVVLDPGNGTSTIIAKEIYEMFPLDVDIIFGESDSTFPNHHPDPCVESNLARLKERVKEVNADLGIGFDGDGDRFGIVDEQGNYIATDKYMIMIARDLVPKLEDKRILFDVKCSKALPDELEKIGGIPVLNRTGNSYNKARVKDENIPFGGELSGHVFFNERWPGFDSGLYAGLRLLEIMSQSDKKVSQLLDGINNYYATEELKFASPDDKKWEVIEKIKEICKINGYNMIDIDGIRVTFKDGWALVRCSNTGPNITARFEATSKERLEKIQEEFTNLINKYNK